MLNLPFACFRGIEEVLKVRLFSTHYKCTTFMLQAIKYLLFKTLLVPTVWQSPFVNVFKYFNVPSWKKATKEGDVASHMVNMIKSMKTQLVGVIIVATFCPSYIISTVTKNYLNKKNNRKQVVMSIAIVLVLLYKNLQ